MEEITINDYYIHFNDLKSLLKFAKEEKEKWKKSLFLRQILLKSCFALEALINQILSQFSMFKNEKVIFEHFEKLSALEKLTGIHTICDGVKSPILEKSENLYAQIKELFKIRNSWVHGKGETHIPVKQDGTMGWIDHEGNSLGKFPVVIIPKGIALNDATKIPINPFELDIKHGQVCLKIVQEVERRVLRGFSLSLEDVHSLTLFDEKGVKIGVSPIKYTWGAYSPEE